MSVSVGSGVRILGFLLLIGTTTSVFGQVWLEDFEGEAAGDNTGTGAPAGVWTTTCVGCNTPSFLNTNSVFEVGDLGNQFFYGGRLGLGGSGMNAEGVWTSPDISILGNTDIAIYLETAAANTPEAGDYCQAYYQLHDGIAWGAETLFHTQPLANVTSYAVSPLLNGSMVRIIVKMRTNDVNEIFFLDNVAVTNTLFSRADANWGVVDTWSVTGINGPTCSCTPNNFSRVVVGGRTVTIAAAAQAADLKINGTADAGGAGIVTFGGNFALTLDLGGTITINAGGQMTAGGFAGSSITYNDQVNHSIVNNGSLGVGDIIISNGSLFTPVTITISGTGTAISLLDDLTVTSTSIQTSTLTSTFNGAFTVGDDITISGTFVGSTLTLSSGITAADLIFAGAGTHTFSKGGASTIGNVTVNGGTTNNLSGAGSLTITGDVDVNAASTNNFTGGAVSIGDDLLLESGSGTTTVNINTAGTFVVTDDIAITSTDDDFTIDRTNALTAESIFINNGDAIIFQGAGALTIAGDIEINEASTLTISGGVTSVGDDLLLEATTGLTTVNINTAGTFVITDDITITSTDDDFTIDKTNAMTLESFVVANGDAITIQGNGTFGVAGNIDVNETCGIAFSGGAFSVGNEILLGANAIVLTNNATGTSTVVNRIYFENGFTTSAITNQATRTITAGSILFDGSTCTFTNNGTVTGPAGVALPITGNAATDDDNVFTNAAGSSLTLSDVNPTNGDFDLLNSGTINQSGNFTNLDNVDTNIDNRNGGTWFWTYTGAGTDTDLNLVLDCSAAINTFHYSGAGNQSIWGSQYHHITFSGSGTKASQANLDANGNVTISGTAILDMDTGDDTFTIAGSWSNTSADADPFRQGTETVTFNGTAGNTITATGGETFYNMVLSLNAAASTLQMINDVTVSNTLTLTTGGLDINGHSLFITRNSIAAMSFTANSYVLGTTQAPTYSPVVWSIRNTAGSFVFPFRSASGGTQISVTFNVTGAGTEAGIGTVSIATYSTAVNNTPYPTGVTHVKDGTGVDQSNAVADRFWVITPSNYTTPPAASVTFQVTAAERAVGNPNLRAQRWSVDRWVTPVIGGQTSTTTSALVAVPVAEMVTSPWTLVSTAVTLPIELLSFTADEQEDGIKLNWATLTELDNDFFTIERMVAKDQFAEVARIAGSGTTTSRMDYEHLDTSPILGKNYYRLKQTDFDKNFSYSGVISVEYKGGVDRLKVYPNPVQGGFFVVEVRNSAKGSLVPIRITNSVGQLVYSAELAADQTGIIRLQLPSSLLPGGLYFVQATPGLKSKLIVE